MIIDGQATDFQVHNIGRRRTTPITSLVPASRFGKPGKMAHTGVFLASDESNFMVNAEVVIDGGFSQS